MNFFIKCYPFGNILLIDGTSTAAINPGPLSFRLLEGLFDVKMCLNFALLHLTLPDAVNLNLFLAELLLFNLYPAIYPFIF